MEILTEPAKKYVDSDIKFKLKLPSYQTRNATGTFIDETNTIEDGKTLLTYKGNTSQEGTPTPSSPINVDVVTGYNNINVSNKNLLNYPEKLKTSYGGLTSTINADGSITTTGKPTYNNVGIIDYNITSMLEVGATYTLSQEANNYLYLQINATNNSSGTTSYYVAKGLAKKSFTVVADTRYVLKLQTGTTSEWGNDTRTITNFYQLEKNSTSTSFVQHQGQSYEVNLGKNLFDGELEMGTISSSNGVNSTSTTIIRSKNYVNVKPNTTYTLSNSTSNNIGLRYYDSSGTFLSSLNASASPRTITTPSNCYRLRFIVVRSDIDTNVQVEVGTQATSYAPYFTPIELCKIGDYQDRIYRQNGNWYLHKEVGKVVLNGSESWSSMGWSNNHYGYRTGISDIMQTTDTSDNSLVIANYYKTIKQADINGDNGNYSVSNRANQTQIIIRNDDYSTNTAFKGWLNSNNVTLYYVLSTPTDTEITNQALINQLEQIWENLKTYQGETIISQTNSDLPFVLDILMEV